MTSTTLTTTRVGGKRVLLVLLLMLSAVLMPPTAADWDQDCPKGCKCTYVSNLKTADCQAAGFTTVPSTLSKEIQKLNLAGNGIKHLEKDAFSKAGLVNLQKLYLSNNAIRTVDKDAFKELKIMIELDLSTNKIEKLHPHTFSGLEKLRMLDLSHNDLERLNHEQFPPLPHLRKLNIRNCQLTYVHNDAFINLLLLDSLKLSGNKLRLLQPELFLRNTLLVELELYDNEWECDCNLKEFVTWVKLKQLVQEHVMCHSPERVSGQKWESIGIEDLACRPQIVIPHVEVPAAPGQNTTLLCRAKGDPTPSIKWVLHGRVLTNMSIIPNSDPEQTYILKESVQGTERSSQLTITHVTDPDLTYYTCVADNRAGLVEQNVTLVAAPSSAGTITPPETMDLYIIIGITVAGVVLLLFLIICICCCLKKRERQQTQKAKLNGDAHMEHSNVLIINPVEKPPRQYEKVPQTDVELQALTSHDHGAHRNYDEVDYPDSNTEQYRSHLATLDEDDGISQDTTLNLDSTPAHSIIADYNAHYPDLIDMTRPRAISPTQLSYHSLMAPQFANREWRMSFVHPAEYSQYPVAYSTPPIVAQQRPGYVTLPRRQRAPSWAGNPSSPMLTSPEAPTMGKFVKDPYYDRLGPRTTADGTSRTDLTRLARIVDPYAPTPSTITSPPSLPLYYTAVLEEGITETIPAPGCLRQRPLQSSTLPRSTPNLLDIGISGGGLSLPHHQNTRDTPSNLSPYLPADSPTPSNASMLHASSPSHSVTSTIPNVHSLKFLNHSSQKSLINTSTSRKLPFELSNESKLDSLHNYSYNNNSNISLSSKKPFDISNQGELMNSIPPQQSQGVLKTGVSSSKKVPPKPPPKPSSKRLSVCSNSSESRKGSLVGEDGRIFQDEGPDGTEV